MSTPNSEYPHTVGVCDDSWAQYTDSRYCYTTGCKLCRFTVTTNAGIPSEVEANEIMLTHIRSVHYPDDRTVVGQALGSNWVTDAS